MKYSELLKKDPNEVGYSAYGVVVDEFILDKKPTHLSRIGFVLDSLDVTNPKNYAFTVMLCLITSGEFKREIIAEIPATTEIDFKKILMISGTKASISLLPPTTDVDEDWTKYTERLKEMFAHWLGENNVSRNVYPIVGYFEYLVLEANGYIPQTISDDEYILKRFVDEFPLDRMDQVKDELKLFVMEYFGGKKEFKAFISAVGLAVQKRAEEECIKYTEELRASGFTGNQQDELLETTSTSDSVKDDILSKMVSNLL